MLQAGLILVFVVTLIALLAWVHDRCGREYEFPYPSTWCHGVATAWGFAEATLFFIVPDLFLSFVASRSPRRASYACLFALLGSLAGGAVMYSWGGADADAALDVLHQIPYVNAEQSSQVAIDFEQSGVAATLSGPRKGIPYKLYAAQAPGHDISLLPFLLVSIPARLYRFVLVVLVTWLVLHKLLARLDLQRKIRVLSAGWVVSYVVYFLRH